MSGPLAARSTLARQNASVTIDAEEMKICLEVLAQVETLPADDPDAVAVRLATARIFKAVKLQRRFERRAAVSANDKDVLARTATAAPGRVDDETNGIELVSTASGAIAGTLIKPRPCYQCKRPLRRG